MEDLKNVLLKLKEAADGRVQIARLEVFTWQKISSAMWEAAHHVGKMPVIKKPTKLNIQEPPPDNPHRYVTVKEACQFLGISRTTIYRLMSEGQIQYTKIGGHVTRYKLQDLENFAQRHIVQINRQ